MRRWVSFSAALLVASGITAAATLVAGCGSGPDAGEASLTLDGRAELTSASRQRATTRDHGGTVDRGTTVKVLAGSASLSFGDGRRIDLQRGTAVKVDEVPTITVGDALLVTEGEPFRAKVAGSSIAIHDGVARVTRGLGFEAASYKGSATITSAGRRMTVGALRRATVAALGVLPNRVEPVRLRSTDAWDRQYLGEAMELSDQLQTRSEGLTAQLADGYGTDLSFFTDVLPVLQRDSALVASLLDTARPPGETLVGAALVSDANTGSFVDRWRDVFTFRDEGAAWGLVALDQRLADANRLSSTLDLALGRAESFTVQAIAAIKAAETVAPVAEVPVETPTNTVPPRPVEQPDPGPVPPTAVPGEAPKQEPQPVRDTLDTVGGLVSGLLGALTGNG
jgi:hypothetical protein